MASILLDCQPLEVVEINRRSSQGVTRPFFCKVRDGRYFWAKGIGAGRRALCCEWVAGCLARHLKLPIPHFSQLYVSQDLVRNSLVDAVSDLGEGLVFGSENIDDVQEFGFSDLAHTIRNQSDIARWTLLFDWWVQNADRTLGENGGNPNLLVRMSDFSVNIIDHNMAFDREWDENVFFSDHVFGQMRSQSSREWLLAAKATICEAMSAIDAVWKSLPDEWLYQDRGQTISVDISMEEVKKVLCRIETELETQWT